MKIVRTGSYRFFRHHGGVSSFADITLSGVTAEQASIEWSQDLDAHRQQYAAAVAEGIAIAVVHRTGRPGLAWRIKVTAFTELLVDTRPDAVTCASAMAAWLAMGGAEADVSFVHEPGGWQARFASLTLRVLDGARAPAELGDSPLDAWYARVRDLPLDRLTIGDLCRACRQELHLDHVAPMLAEAVLGDPSCGAQYAGEGVSALARVRPWLWACHGALAQRLAERVRAALPGFEAEVIDDAKELLLRLEDAG